MHIPLDKITFERMAVIAKLLAANRKIRFLFNVFIIRSQKCHFVRLLTGDEDIGSFLR